MQVASMEGTMTDTEDETPKPRLTADQAWEKIEPTRKLFPQPGARPQTDKINKKSAQLGLTREDDGAA